MEYGQLLFKEQYADVAVARVKKMICTSSQCYCVLVRTKQARDGIIVLLKRYQLPFSVRTTITGYIIEFTTKYEKKLKKVVT